MLKKLLLYGLPLAMFFSSCKKSSDPIFEDSDTRINAKLAEDQQILTSAANGWQATIFPRGGKGFSFYFKFANDNSVVMMSDFNATSAITPKSSTYRLKALQLPSLIFDTYNYLHLLADPDASVSGGTTGNGLLSDFQFAIANKLVGDTLALGGLDEGNLVLMVKLTKDQETAILAGRLGARLTEHATYVGAHPYPYISIKEGVQADVTFTTATKSIKFNYPNDAGVTTTTAVTYAITVDGISISQPVVIGGITIDRLYWDADVMNYYFVAGGSKTYIKYGTHPNSSFDSMMGFGKIYTYMEYNPTTLKGTLNAPFDVTYTALKTELNALSGRTPLYVGLTFQNDTTAQLKVNYNNSAGTNYSAYYTYKYKRAADGTATFSYVGPDATNTNGTAILNGTVTLRAAFEGTFKLNWVENTIPGSALALGALSRADNNSPIFYGIPK